MAYQQQQQQQLPSAPASSSSSSSPPPPPPSTVTTGPQGPPLNQPPASAPQYGGDRPTAGAMLPPSQRPSQAPVNAVNNLSQPPPTTTTAINPPSSVPNAPVAQASGPASMTAAAATPDSSAPKKATASPKAGALTPHQKEQVNALLAVNTLLLQEVQKLQSSGAAVPNTHASPQQQHAPPTKPGSPDHTREAQKSPTGSSQTPTSTTPTPQTPKGTKPNAKAIYDHYLKRVQLTIAFLLALQQGRATPAHPNFMEPPPLTWFLPNPGDSAPDDAEQKGREAYNSVKEAYQKLKDLWPNYNPNARQAQQARQQQPNPSGSAPSQAINSPQQGNTPSTGPPRAPAPTPSQAPSDQQPVQTPPNPANPANPGP